MSKKKKRKESVREYEKYRMNHPDGIRVATIDNFSYDESVAKKARKQFRKIKEGGIL